MSILDGDVRAIIMNKEMHVCFRCGYEHERQHRFEILVECPRCKSHELAEVNGIVNQRWLIIWLWRCKVCGFELVNKTGKDCPQCHYKGTIWQGYIVRFRRGTGFSARLKRLFTMTEGKDGYAQLAKTCK
jgi:predicted Zn-ribbon and HTH transcriptional regulator